MALIKCFECKNQISDQAKTCPHCGVRLKKSHPIRTTLIILFCLFLVYLFFGVFREYSEVSNYAENTLGKNKLSEKEQLQREVKIWLNSKEEVKELGLKCLSVGLVKESQNKYIGLARFDNGEETHVDVTTDGDQYLMSAKFPLEKKKKEKQHEFQEGQKVKFTKGMYDQIENGMSYNEVVQILGQEGEQISSSDIEGYSTEMYMWQNLDGSNLNIVIQNGIVSMKNQFGLTGGITSTKAYSPEMLEKDIKRFKKWQLAERYYGNTNLLGISLGEWLERVRNVLENNPIGKPGQIEIIEKDSVITVKIIKEDVQGIVHNFAFYLSCSNIDEKELNIPDGVEIEKICIPSGVRATGERSNDSLETWIAMVTLAGLG